MSGVSGGITGLIAGGQQQAASTQATWVQLKMSQAALQMQQAQYDQMMELAKPFLDKEMTLEDQQIAMNELSKKAAEMGIDFQKWQQDTLKEQQDWAFAHTKEKSEWAFGTQQEQTAWAFDTLKDSVQYRKDMQSQLQQMMMSGPGDFDSSEYAKTARSNIDRTMAKITDQMVSAGLASGPTGSIGKDLMDYGGEIAANEVANQRQNWLQEWATSKLAPSTSLLADASETLGGGLATGLNVNQGEGMLGGAESYAPQASYGSSGVGANLLGAADQNAANMSSLLLQGGATAGQGILNSAAAGTSGLLGFARGQQQAGTTMAALLPTLLGAGAGAGASAGAGAGSMPWGTFLA